MRFCLEIWGTDYRKIKDTCLLAEKLGYYGYYYGESLAEIDLDCWTILGALAAETSTVKLGPVITYLLPQYRNIALLAKQAVTLQEISYGRLEFRTGAGATPEYAGRWWYPYGIDYPEDVKRVSILEEGLKALQILWNRPSAHLNGRYFKLSNAILHRPGKSIPVTLAARGRRMMRIAAKYADIWEASYLSPEDFSKLSFVVDNFAKKFGRQVERSLELDVIIADSDSDLNKKERIVARQRGSEAYRRIQQNGLVGKPDVIAQRVRQYVEAGVEQFLLAFQDPFDANALQLFIEAVS
jgi:alkanesulfonate monooxygenase SsuD/methylene tetrahydromethanopterin reductase-like flavin-dependent oxidoreductase (luciferase family)